MTQSRTVRRRDVLPVLLPSLLVLGVLLGWWANWPVPRAMMLAECGVVFSFGVCCYLVGPTASVAVGRTRVLVRNAFVGYDVPRRLVTEVDVNELSGIRLSTGSGASIAVKALMPAMIRPTSVSVRSLRGRARPLTDALVEIPAEPVAGEVERRWRGGNIGLAIVALVVFIVCARYAFAHQAPLSQS